VKIVHEWLAELVDVPADVELVAREISLRGFEVASVDRGVIDFEITANRPDCLSHQGIAREASVIWRTPLKLPQAAPFQSSSDVLVTIDDPDGCPRYSAQLFEVKVGRSPDWLAKRLEAAGVRPINNIVDVSNYVMLELGQPTHAFDLDKLAGGRLVIRRARKGERLRTLDGVDRELDPEMVVIADADRPVAIGGVMGGQESEISGSTRTMVLESASFQPASVRRTSKKLNLKTEASTRFERGGDIEATTRALGRAAELLVRIGAAAPRGAVDVYPSRREAVEVPLRSHRIARVLGVPVPAESTERILNGLGFAEHRIGPKDPGTHGPRDPEWLVTVPTFRVDVAREADLIEEVGRHYGFDKIPITFPPLEQPQPPPDPRIERDRRMQTVMRAAGLSESMTFAFIERAAALPFCEPGTEPTAIANPLSEKFAVLRPSLLPGLIDSCAHNRRRGRKDVRLFEIGSRFTGDGERRAAAFVWIGDGSTTHWSSSPRPVDLFDVKGVAELLCRALGANATEFSQSTAAFLVPGRAATITIGRRTIGVIGQLDPSVAESRGLPPGEAIYVGETDVDALAELAAVGELKAETPPKFPAIVRDLSILIDEALPAAAVRGTIRSAAPNTLESIAEFDRYQGKGVPDGRVSLSLRLTFRSAVRSLTDPEVDTAMNAIVGVLKDRHDADRR
jgi:phenylalanyl-tRNA synthetase beta chain